MGTSTGAPRDRRRTHFFLEHTLRINDFRIATLLAAKDHNAMLMEWVDERGLRAMDLRLSTRSQAGQTLPLRPDGFFALEIRGKRASFFLEVIRGPCPQGVFRPR